MRNIVIEYLGEVDRAKLAYTSILSNLENLNSIRCNTIQELTNRLMSINTDIEPLIVTILTHGHTDGIVYDSLKSLLFPWATLCEIVNSMRTANPLILNLAGVCKSELIRQPKIVSGQRIDVIWATTGEVDSISKSLIIAAHGNFETFNSLLDDEEAKLYVEII